MRSSIAHLGGVKLHFRCCRYILDLDCQQTMPRSLLHVGLALVAHLCLTVSPVQSTHDHKAVMHRTFRNMATDGIAPSRPPPPPLKITSNRRCRENRERISAGDRQTKSSNKNLKTMFFSISKSDKRKKKEREACTRRRSFFVIVPASGDVPRLVCEREGAA